MPNRLHTVYYRTRLLTRQEKERLVIEIYKQDKTIREIAKQVHMSFTDISAIIRKEFGPPQEHSLELSKDTQALKLFAKGEKPLDVAIKFNIAANEVQRLHREYRSLCEMNELDKLYKELGDDIEPFLQLYKIMKEQGFTSQEITNTVRYANDIPILELRYENVKDEVKRIENQKQNLISEIESLKNDMDISGNLVANLNQAVEKKASEVKSLTHKQQRYLDVMLDLMGSKDYRKIKDIARQHTETILSDKKALLEFTLFAVVQALKLDPEKQILISDMPTGSSQSYYMEHQRKELLDLAQQLYNGLSKELVNATLNSVFIQQELPRPVIP